MNANPKHIIKSLLKNMKNRDMMRDVKKSYLYFSKLSRKNEIGSINFQNGQAIITLKDNRKFGFNPVSHMASSLFSIPVTGEFEKKETDIVRKLVSEGENCIDVGANFGYYTALLSQEVGETGSVHAFEPLPHTFQILEDNIKLNSLRNVATNELALDENSGEREIFLPDIGISGSFKLHKYRNGFKKFLIKTQSLDDYIRENEIHEISFIKADIEGAELLLLKGAEQIIRKCLPLLFLEIQENSTRLFEYEPSDIINYLKGFGYRMFYVKSVKLVEVEVCSSLPDYNFFFLSPDAVKKHHKFIV